MKPFKFAAIQLGCPGTPSKEVNFGRAVDKVHEAAKAGAQVILLPEYCCLRVFAKQPAEADAEVFGIAPSGDFSKFDVLSSPSPILRKLSQVAHEEKVWLFAGSYPEREGDKVYNTMPVFNPQGRLVATYRKTHLCDLPFMDNVRESDFISPGEDIVIVDSDFCKIGLAICYDIRFAPLCAAMADRGACLVLYPAFFPARTGKLHWSTLQRARALDHQVYVATCGRATDSTIAWDPWGHSAITDPSGQNVAETGGEETILYCTIDPTMVAKTQKSLGVRSGLRPDLYKKFLSL